ncbi:hypothetical protein ACH4Y0_04150 [Streptomyces sp. NPDC020707]|jgi:hypothetical protein|uniref:hypothetical protein n=1 Tax=Streptomyces TaxID=1883 RepID=UPI0028D5E0E5|nr:hypothetical protein [Streptomyces sp. DSM 40484]
MITSGLDAEADRADFLGATSSAWQELPAADYPFLHAVAGQMRDHDDREQFLTGVAIVLDGLTRLH